MKNEMMFIVKEDHGCIYTIDEDSHELYYAPIYDDNSVNLSEFAPVDIADVNDEYDVCSIQRELIALNS